MQPIMMQQPIPMDMTNAPQELPLRGIHLPAEPGFWPLAPGWWALILVLVLLVTFMAVKGYQRRKRFRRYVVIEQQLAAINFAYKEDKDKRKLLSELSMLLRRFEKFQQNKNQAVAWSGAAWIEHLNSYHKDQPFTDYQALLTDVIYLPQVEFEPDALSELIQMHFKRVVMTPPKKLAKNIEKKLDKQEKSSVKGAANV